MKLKLALSTIVGCAALSLALPALGQYAPGQYWGEYAGPALVDQSSVTVTYTGPYESVWDGSTGAGLYGGSVNGHTAGIVCDDFYDEIGTPDTWTANAYQASNLANTFGHTLFGSAIGLNGYAELATLASLILSNGSGPITFSGQSYTHTEISAAMWSITGGINTASDPLVAKLVSAVKAVVGSNSSNLSAYLAQFSDLFVLTPTSKGSNPATEPQEMWVEEHVPEGGAALLYLLLAGMTCFGAMKFNSRNEFGIRAA